MDNKAPGESKRPGGAAVAQSPDHLHHFDITVLIGPCDHEDAEDLAQKVAEHVKGRLGAVVSLSWEPDHA